MFRAESTSKILNLMYSTPEITIAKLSELVGINMAAVNKQIKKLVTKGYVQRSEKDGSWRLIITPSKYEKMQENSFKGRWYIPLNVFSCKYKYE